MQSPDRRSKPKRWEINAISFIFLYSIANSILYQWPLYSRAVSSIEVFDVGGFFSIATLFVLQLTISLTVLLVFSLVSQRLTKALCILLFFGNSIAVYFITSYGVILDSTMMGNIYNTKFSETFEFVNPKLMLYAFFWGSFPVYLYLGLV
jgi:lipid A ethanolaminephosphotransferase